jgi:hypothetical protein
LQRDLEIRKEFEKADKLLRSEGYLVLSEFENRVRIIGFENIPVALSENVDNQKFYKVERFGRYEPEIG